MSSLKKGGDRVAIMKLNAELRHAQLEMLSAQCATDRLRLNFTPDHIAQHGEPEVLRKAVSSAAALHDYYKYVAQRITAGDPTPLDCSLFDQGKIAEAVTRVAQYLRQQREDFLPQAVWLTDDHKQAVAPFFNSSLLQSVRVVTLKNQRIPNPPFYVEAKDLGLTNLPELTHMSSLTFEDVLVFHGEITARSLFHALVHAAQFSVLGLERYTELFVRGFFEPGRTLPCHWKRTLSRWNPSFPTNPTNPSRSKRKFGCGITRGATRTPYPVFSTQ